MGFLDGLGTILGGFNAVRRIDEDGFDYREQDEFRDFERQRQQELAQQENEDRGVNLASNYFLGTDQPDMGVAGQAFGPKIDQARREFLLTSALGETAKSRPAIEAQKSNAAYQRELLKGQQRANEIGLRGDEAEALARIKSTLEMGQQPSPRDRFIAEEASKRTGMTIQGMIQRATMGDNRRLIPVTTTEGGSKITRYLTRDEVRTQGGPEGPGFEQKGTTELNRTAAAKNSLDLGNQILQELQTPDIGNTLGPIMGRYRNLEAAAGAGDPAAMYLRGSIKSLAALQPQIHGFRAVQFAHDIENNLLKTTQTPQALAAAIQGLLQASNAVSGADLYQYMPSDFTSQYAGAFQDVPDAGTRTLEELGSLGLTPEQILQMLESE